MLPLYVMSLLTSLWYPFIVPLYVTSLCHLFTPPLYVRYLYCLIIVGLPLYATAL